MSSGINGTNAAQPVVLVTGASAGIGRATAQALAARGRTVWAAARRRDALDALAAEGGGRIHALEMDVTRDDSVRAGIERIGAAGGWVEILVNNAGFGQLGAVEDVTVEQLRYQFDVNVFGAMRVAQAVLPTMRERRRGKILNVSSPAGVMSMPLGGPYCASKAALEALSSALRFEVEPFGVQVVVVRPGVIATEFQEVAKTGSLPMGDSSPYADTYRKVAKLFVQLESRASPPSVVADAIVEAALRDQAPQSVNVPADAKASVALASLVPQRALDGVYRFALSRVEP